jgi:hypothetical protein
MTIVSAWTADAALIPDQRHAQIVEQWMRSDAHFAGTFTVHFESDAPWRMHW